MTVIQRSPLHDKALTREDLTVGRRIAQIHTSRREVRRGVIIKGVHIAATGIQVGLSGIMVQFDSGLKEFRDLGDSGVEPYAERGWNDMNFILDESDLGEGFPAYNEYINVAMAAWRDQVNTKFRELDRIFGF